MERSRPDMMSLSRDLLANIISRLDGPTIATLAGTCTELRGLSRDQALWRLLCKSAWPSTALEEGQRVISSSPLPGFDRFYADSYPLLTHNIDHHFGDHIPTSQTPATDFASFVDIYYHHSCIFSRVLDSIPDIEHLQEGGNPNNLQKWFTSRPFKLELLSAYSDGEGVETEDTHLALSLYMENEVKDYSQELQQAVRLSWVMLEKTKGQAVNLSSWKPLMVKKSWPSHENYEMSFGCVIPVEENVLVKCQITTRCKLMMREGFLRWEEISLRFEDTMGAHLPGSKSLMIMNTALQCLRVRDHTRAHKGYIKFEAEKQEMLRKRKVRETILDWLCVSIEVTIFVAATYCILRF